MIPRAWSDSSRPHWGSRVQFTLSAVCLACGFNCLVNVPLSAARNGGGTFIVVYAALLFLIGYPITLLLCLLGQYYQVGKFPMAKSTNSTLKSPLFILKESVEITCKCQDFLILGKFR